MEAAGVELHDWKQAAAQFVHLLRWEHEVLSGYERHRKIVYDHILRWERRTDGGLENVSIGSLRFLVFAAAALAEGFVEGLRKDRLAKSHYGAQVPFLAIFRNRF